MITLRRLRVVLAVLGALAALLAGAWLWLRDSSLVAVEHVKVTGQSGPDADAIRSALIAAARRMTTLDLDVGRLRHAVSRYPVVKDLRADTQFPHSVRIHVIEELPVAGVVAGARAIAAAADGTLLPAASASGLPVIDAPLTPGSSRLTDPAGRRMLALLGAAPYELLSRVSQASTVAPHGLVAQVRGGPSIYFGQPDRLAAKWIAASEVLGDSGSAGASYIDVTDPERPAAGAPGGSPAASSGASPSTLG
jgi:hypothetical protein